MIDIQEDHDIKFRTTLSYDIKFRTTLSYFIDDDQFMFEEINVELLDVNGSESVHSFISAPAINVDVNGSSAAAQLYKFGFERDNTSRNEQDSFSESSLMDTIVPDNVMPEKGTGSAREMWLGREFLDRKAFKRVIVKYVIYNNFTLIHERTNMKIVTTSYKRVDCLGRIHASMVDSGPHFRVRKHIFKHYYFKPFMGIAHRQATTKLVAEFIEEKVRYNDDFRSKEIINECQIEFENRITYKRAHMTKEFALCKVRKS